MDMYNVISTFSSEINEDARKVTMEYAPDTIELGDIRDITMHTIQHRIMNHKGYKEYQNNIYWEDEDIHFIVVAGPPCQVRLYFFL